MHFCIYIERWRYNSAGLHAAFLPFMHFRDTAGVLHFSRLDGREWSFLIAFLGPGSRSLFVTSTSTHGVRLVREMEGYCRHFFLFAVAKF